MKRLLAIIAFLVVALFASPTLAASRTYASSSAQGTMAIEMRGGDTQQVTLKFKNAGSYTWRGTGKNYVSLYATGPYKRRSVFWQSGWASAYQTARLGQATVAPGKTGSVTFTLHAPAKPGTYTEQFQLAVENVAWIYGSVLKLHVTVLPEIVTTSTKVNAHAYVVMDAETGAVLAEQNADEVRSIASITKLMTVMVARETGLDPANIVALERSDEVGGGRLRVRVGTQLSVRNLVASAIVGSANNAANALARATGLPRDIFIAQMDAKAKAMGLNATSFADPTGIEVENFSTAREVALMAKTAFSDPWISEFEALPEYEVATSLGPHLIKNTNKLITDDTIEVQGGKTGFTYEAGYSLVTRLKKAGARELIVVILGCDTLAASFHDAKVMAEKAWLDPSLALAL